MTTTIPDLLERQTGEVQLALDDAFADGDEQPFEFSSAAVRQHLAEQVHWTVGQATETASVEELDTSTSTLCLDGSTSGSKSDPASIVSQLHVPADQQSSHDLSNVPLSVPEKQVDHHSNVFHEKDYDGEGPSHPMVHIDVSKPPSSRVSVITPSGDGTASSDVTPCIEQPSPPPPVLDLPTSLPNAQVSVSPSQNRESSRSTGPSAFQKALNKTRPSFLPPKNRQEDKKHLSDWEVMMKQSRAAGDVIWFDSLPRLDTETSPTEEKRRKALHERRLARELQIEQSIHVWEKEIAPDWRVVHRDPGLRKMWWNGIPTKLRGPMWERAVGNALTLTKDSYRSCLARAKKALASGVFPEETLQAIEEDILTTLPALHIFRPESGPLYQDLKDLLCAWVVSRADEGLCYYRGASRIAAMILINMSAPQGFVVMRNLLERHCLRSFYGDASTKEDVEAYYRIFDTLLADSMPKIYFNFKQHQISPAAYLPDWLIPLFLDHLPFEACARLWDVVMLEGDSFLFRAALAVLATLEPRLFFPGRQELLELLNGENKAAIEVARRDGRRLDGGKYEIYGINEETLWDRIESMNDWWRETTWRRLTQRELPDI